MSTTAPLPPIVTPAATTTKETEWNQIQPPQNESQAVTVEMKQKISSSSPTATMSSQPQKIGDIANMDQQLEHLMCNSSSSSSSSSNSSSSTQQQQQQSQPLSTVVQDPNVNDTKLLSNGTTAATAVAVATVVKQEAETTNTMSSAVRPSLQVEYSTSTTETHVTPPTKQEEDNCVSSTTNVMKVDQEMTMVGIGQNSITTTTSSLPTTTDAAVVTSTKQEEEQEKEKEGCTTNDTNDANASPPTTTCVDNNHVVTSALVKA
mmetsp:Transcript_5246/g.7402  ORF Transcript_5246/g.7402 Transcript_5246/m.7402 type:complete len:262 (+) Transcript_5246:1685-2470(+)